LTNLGSARDVMFQNDTKENLSFGVTWRLRPTRIEILAFYSIFLQREELDFSCEFQNFNDILQIKTFSYNSTPVVANKFKTFQKFYRLNHIVPQIPGDLYFPFDNFATAFEELFFSVFYLAPIRSLPKRVYSWSGAAPSNVGKSGENTIAALLAARASNRLINGKPLEVVISEKLEQLGLIHSFCLEELREGTNIFRVLLRRTPESPKVSLTDVGFGVSQLLPVLVLLYYVPEGSTVILEQPELHLHPSVQAGLADVFIDAWQTRGIQILLESHSEHLLQRLQRRVAEEKVPNTDMALYFCSLEQGESKLTTLDLDEYGAIRNYPKDFFGDRFEEVAATAETGIKRQLELVGT
jgi:hypothetical protein